MASHVQTIDAVDAAPLERASPAVVSSGRFYRPELDAIRLTAFLGVFLCHAIPTDRVHYDGLTWMLFGQAMAFVTRVMSLGLPLFFFLSAYLIAALFLIENDRNGAIHVGAFYVRRILRIWPLYYLSLAIAVVFALVYGKPGDLTSLGFYALFLSNAYYALHPWSSSIMGPLWSISLEEQFYLVLPILILVFGTGRLARIGMGFVLLALATLTVEGIFQVADMKVWTNVLSQTIFFGTGILCAALTHGKTIEIGPAMRTIALLVAVALFAAATKAIEVWPNAGAAHAPLLVGGYALAAMGCVVLFLAATNLPYAFPKFVLFLGKISFGLYVFHFAFVRVFYAYAGNHATWLALLALVPTIAVASLSYRYVESPFLRLRKRFTLVENRKV